MERIKVRYTPYELELKYPFTISRFSRTSTPIMLVELSYEGFTGLGEASMVPYMGESHETAAAFLSRTDLSFMRHPFDHAALISYLDELAPGNPAVKAALDMALYDLRGKLENKPCYTFFDADPHKMPVTSVTIGIDTPEIIAQKVAEAYEARVIKIKLGRDNDEELVRTIRQVTDKPLYADANQGWADPQEGLDKIHWLHEQGVVLIEQPMAKDDRDGNAWITARSPIPIIGDEAVQRLEDVTRAGSIYHGINLKLMKSAGLYEGYQMIRKARELGLSVLIGCMSETSIATLAGAALAPLCSWADLDGPFLTKNNPYHDPEFKDGKWVLSERPGLGVQAI